MSATPPDPKPEESPGLSPGSSVPPGETPPSETSATRGVSEQEPKLPSSGTNKVVYAVLGVVVLLVVLMFVGYAVGIMS